MSTKYQSLLLASLISMGTLYAQNDPEFPLLEGPYMGQEPPGMVAEPFAPGIISKDGWEIEGVFAPGMKEFYFTMDRGTYTKENPTNFKPTVIGFRQENNVWRKYTEFRRRGEVSFSPDGTRMHMAEGYKDRVEGDQVWSERKSLGPMFDREDWGIMRLTASAKGTYVFDDYKSGDAIRISTVKDGERQAPVKMGPVVNSGKLTAHPFIAPDESYLIWDSEREGGFGDSDLYISFKQADGSWGPATNMGSQVNSPKWDAYASVTSDGKYMLFNRGIDDSGDNNDIYWVDAKIIETLRSMKGPYLGQKTPALTPEVFAPGIVTTDGWGDAVSFAPEMNKFYVGRWRVVDDKVERKYTTFKQVDNQWQEVFDSTLVRLPTLSPDGKTMYTRSNYKERTETGWSEAKSLGSAFEELRIMTLKTSAKGTLVLDEIGNDGDGLIRYSRLVDGRREEPKAFGKAINTGAWNAHPYIAPDESYIMWDGERETGYGNNDIYISFRQADGSWGDAINLGAEINTDAEEGGPQVTPDGKYLFFNRMVPPANGDGPLHSDLYWVDAKIIDKLRPQQ